MDEIYVLCFSNPLIWFQILMQHNLLSRGFHMLCFCFCMLIYQWRFFPQEYAGMSPACFEVIMAISSQNFAIYWLRREKKRNSKILRKYLATNMHQYMMVILSSWDLFALLSRNVQLQPPCCFVCTHMFDPRSKSIMLILNHLGPRRTPRDSCTRLPLGDQPPCSAHSIATILQNCTQIH